MTTTACAAGWSEIANKALREAAWWRENFDVLQRALVGNTGASGIEVAHALRKDAARYRWLRDRKPGGTYRIAGMIYGDENAAFDAAIDAAMAAEAKA